MSSNSGSTGRRRRASLPPGFNTPDDPFTDFPQPNTTNVSHRRRSSVDSYRDGSIGVPSSYGRGNGSIAAAASLHAIPEDERFSRIESAQQRGFTRSDGTGSDTSSSTFRARERDSALLSLNGEQPSAHTGGGRERRSGTSDQPDPPRRTYGSPVVRQRNPFTDDYAHSPKLGSDPGFSSNTPRTRPITRYSPTVAPRDTVRTNQVQFPVQEYRPARSTRATGNAEVGHTGTFSRLKGLFSYLTTEPELHSPPISRAPSPSNSPTRFQERDSEKQYEEFEKDNFSKSVGRNDATNDMFLRAMEINRGDETSGQDPDGRLHEFDENAQLFPMTGKEDGRRKEIHFHLPQVPERLHHLPFDPHVHRDGEGGLRIGTAEETKTPSHPRNLTEAQKISYRERRKKPRHRIVYNRDSKCNSYIGHSQICNSSFGSHRCSTSLHTCTCKGSARIWFTIPSSRTSTGVRRKYLRSPRSVRSHAWMCSNIIRPPRATRFGDAPHQSCLRLRPRSHSCNACGLPRSVPR